MRLYHLYREQWLPIKPGDAWHFFSQAGNLATITPTNLDFVIIGEPPAEEIYSGMQINYYLKPLLNIRVKWQTEITKVLKPVEFTDRQTKGPYAFWEHNHRFVEKNGGTLVIDRVAYALPFGVAGRIAHLFLVKKRLEEIFNFRHQKLASIFSSAPEVQR